MLRQLLLDVLLGLGLGLGGVSFEFAQRFRILGRKGAKLQISDSEIAGDVVTDNSVNKRVYNYPACEQCPHKREGVNHRREGVKS